jgi:hypothetical protein
MLIRNLISTQKSEQRSFYAAFQPFPPIKSRRPVLQQGGAVFI